MQIPNNAKAYIPAAKLTEYLLSKTHAVGRTKARFFRSLGFDEVNVVRLEAALLTIARTEPVVDMVTSVHGTKYVIDGPLETPNGLVVRVRTVWVVEPGQDAPRFVTAYPVG